MPRPAWWTGRIDDFFDLAQRSYAAHVAEGNRLRAGFVALRLAYYYDLQLKPAVASGWQNRAERLLAAEPEAAEHGYLALAHSAAARMEGHFDEALEHTSRAHAIGQRFDDRDLVMRAVQQEGTIRIAHISRAASGSWTRPARPPSAAAPAADDRGGLLQHDHGVPRPRRLRARR